MTEQAHPEWDANYTADTSAPWDIGRPQPAFVRLADEGRLTGRLLDAGCGTGENARSQPVVAPMSPASTLRRPRSRGRARKRPSAGWPRGSKSQTPSASAASASASTP